MSLLQVEQRDSTRILTLDDPDRRNILSTELCAELSQAVAEANDDAATKAIVVTGSGKAFCAGAHLDDLRAAADGRADAVKQVYAAFMAVANSPLPTLAAVNGPAVGAGFNLALACDFRIASPRALFDTRFLKLGLHPGGGCTWMLLRAVGWANASRMLLAGQSVGADEAVRIGLASRVAAAEALAEDAAALLAHLTTVPRELIVRTKLTLRLAATEPHAAIFAHETAEQLWSLGEPGFSESIDRLTTGR